MIYKWLNLDYSYVNYIGTTKQYKKMLRWFDPVIGVPLVGLNDWEIPTVEQSFDEDDEKRVLLRITDAVQCHFLTSLISEKAKHALADIWDKHATLYPVVLVDQPDTPYYMVVLHTVIDCIDRQKSTGRMKMFGKDKDKGYFSSIDTWVMREEEIGDNFMFVLPDSDTTIYVTETFKQRVIESGLTGFGFVKHVCDDTAFIS